MGLHTTGSHGDSLGEHATVVEAGAIRIGNEQIVCCKGGLADGEEPRNSKT